MRALIILVILAGSLLGINAQVPLKEITGQPFVAPQPIRIAKAPSAIDHSARLGKEWHPGSLPAVQSTHDAVSSMTITSSGSFWIDMHPNDLWAQRSSVKTLMEKIIPASKREKRLPLDWNIISENEDQNHVKHIRVQQMLAGIPIHAQDMILHIDGGELRNMNGFAWTAAVPQEIPDAVTPSDAISAGQDFLKTQNVKFQEQNNFPGLHQQETEATLVWYPVDGVLKLAYEIEIHPNLMDHWKVFIDATSFNILEAYSQLCSFAPLQLYNLPARCESDPKQEYEVAGKLAAPVLDGATVVTDQDLKGINRTVNGYQVGTGFFMIDASRTGMYQPAQSVMPNEPSGVIWTIDAQNTSPQQSSFEVVQVTNNNNNWKNLEVSAHYNGGEAYEYFRQTFNRNSINGSGGNIISIINVTDENDNNMDNAFWNGAAIFYGNGDVAFQQLAKGLDVAGHEMSHGVIQNTANLEYEGQSGALNESYADIFGAMIDREDWKIGEDVVNLNVFPTGTMRDMENPNNGGNSLGDIGWQPKHMNEFQNLPNTPEGDNGGVHVNSGIPNRAFFLLATAIGKDKAEQIYYKALTDYLVKSSQFVDMRNAAEKAAGDLHGTGSAEVNAVRNAFAGVGIGAGAGEDYEEDIETNSGDDFILATDEFESDLYWIPPGNPGQFVKMDVPAPISRPSFTDDGASCVYVAQDNNMILINFDWSQGLSFQAFFLEDNPQGIWRNVVASKDGSKIAYTTANLRNEIYVYDFLSGANDVFVLFNPTTGTGGINTGDVLYPDVMEWDYSGEHIMYDALNRIESSFGDGIEYWDISFLNAWDNTSDDFGTGTIGKLFSALPENISVGNPSFAKNSPYIIVFDFLESYFDIFGQVQTEFSIKAANIESGDLNDIYFGTTAGYPNYSKADDKILFTYDNNGTLLLATIDVQHTDKTLPVLGSDVILINGAQKGVWFATGSRDFTSTEDLTADHNLLTVNPQPATDVIRISDKDLMLEGFFTVTDLTGRLLISGKLSAQEDIDISSLIPGTYLLRLKSDQSRVYHTKFVKH